MAYFLGLWDIQSVDSHTARVECLECLECLECHRGAAGAMCPAPAFKRFELKVVCWNLRMATAVVCRYAVVVTVKTVKNMLIRFNIFKEYSVFKVRMDH